MDEFREPLLFADASFFDVFTFPLQQGVIQPGRSPHRTAWVLSEAAARKVTSARRTSLGGSFRFASARPSTTFTVSAVSAPVPEGVEHPLRRPSAAVEAGAGGPAHSPRQTGARSRRAPTSCSRAARRCGGRRGPPGGICRSDASGGPGLLHPLHASAFGRGALVAPAWGGTSSPRATRSTRTSSPASPCSSSSSRASTSRRSRWGARPSGRRRSGMRKALGAVRGQLVRQFWGEALLICGVAPRLEPGDHSAGAPLLQQLLRPATPPRRRRSGGAPPDRGRCSSGWGSWRGSYPALYLSRFRPAEVLKGRDVPADVLDGSCRRWSWCSFTLSVFLIISTLLMAQQLRLVQERDLGFDKEQVVRIKAEYGATWEGVDVMKRYPRRARRRPGRPRHHGVDEAAWRGGGG